MNATCHNFFFFFFFGSNTRDLISQVVECSLYDRLLVVALVVTRSGTVPATELTSLISYYVCHQQQGISKVEGGPCNVESRKAPILEPGMHKDSSQEDIFSHSLSRSNGYNILN